MQQDEKKLFAWGVPKERACQYEIGNPFQYGDHTTFIVRQGGRIPVGALYVPLSGEFNGRIYHRHKDKVNPDIVAFVGSNKPSRQMSKILRQEIARMQNQKFATSGVKPDSRLASTEINMAGAPVGATRKLEPAS